MYPGQVASASADAGSQGYLPVPASASSPVVPRQRRFLVFLLGFVGFIMIINLLRAGPHDFENGASSPSSLSSFYSRHVSCRSCLRSPSFSTPDYVQSKLNRWCPSKYSTNPSIRPMAENDYDGVCISQSSAPSCADGSPGFIQQSECAQDPPATKQSCSLCVLDDWTWCAGKYSDENGDEYDGVCFDPKNPPTKPSQSQNQNQPEPADKERHRPPREDGTGSHSGPGSFCPHRRVARELHHCVNIMNGDLPMEGEHDGGSATPSSQGRHRGFPIGIFFIVGIVGLGVFLFLRWRRLRRQRAAQSPALVNPAPAFAAVPMQQAQQQPQPQQQQQAAPQPAAPVFHYAAPAAARPAPLPVAQPILAPQPQRPLYPSLSSRGEEMEMPYIRMSDNPNYPQVR